MFVLLLSGKNFFFFSFLFSKPKKDTEGEPEAAGNVVIRRTTKRVLLMRARASSHLVAPPPWTFARGFASPLPLLQSMDHFAHFLDFRKRVANICLFPLSKVIWNKNYSSVKCFPNIRKIVAKCFYLKSFLSFYI